MTAVQLLRKEVKEKIDQADEQSLRMVRAMLEVREEEDWWDTIGDDAKASIERGLKDAKEGRLTPHKEVMKQYKKWL